MVRKTNEPKYVQVLGVPSAAFLIPDAHLSSSALADLLQMDKADERVAVWLRGVDQT